MAAWFVIVMSSISFAALCILFVLCFFNKINHVNQSFNKTNLVIILFKWNKSSMKTIKLTQVMVKVSVWQGFRLRLWVWLALEICWKREMVLPLQNHTSCNVQPRNYRLKYVSKSRTLLEYIQYVNFARPWIFLDLIE